MEEAIRELTEVMRSMGGGTDWTAIVTAISSILSLFGVVVLMIERKEKRDLICKYLLSW
ncbi:MAG: hypothetical protein IKV30_03265 [Clostridia bacterium]|nr:hypothetical protein [Clostridia bacterium]